MTKDNGAKLSVFSTIKEYLYQVRVIAVTPTYDQRNAVIAGLDPVPILKSTATLRRIKLNVLSVKNVALAEVSSLVVAFHEPLKPYQREVIYRDIDM